MLSSVEILILSAIQGISEFLPVSSAAHFVTISKYYAFTNQNLFQLKGILKCLLAINYYYKQLNFYYKNNNFSNICCDDNTHTKQKQ